MDRRQRIRAAALGLAVKAWSDPHGLTSIEHAEKVAEVAGTFAAFLADDDGADDPGPCQPPPPSGLPGLPGMFADWARVMRETPKVVEAAVHWVDAAYLQNTTGLNNWRNWADEKDINLINAVLAYRGQEPLQ